MKKPKNTYVLHQFRSYYYTYDLNRNNAPAKIMDNFCPFIPKKNSFIEH